MNTSEATTKTYNMNSPNTYYVFNDYTVSNKYIYPATVSDFSWYKGKPAQHKSFKTKIMIESQKKIKKATIYKQSIKKNKRYYYKNKVKTLKINKKYKYFSLGNNCIVYKIKLSY